MKSGMILGVQEGFNVKYTNILEKLIKQFFSKTTLLQLVRLKCKHS